MADANNTLSVFDQFLRIWAIIGPMLAACVAAWWNRKNEIDNREFNQRRENDNEKRRIAQQNAEKIINLKKNETSELKKSILSFVSLAVDCQNAAITNGLKSITSLAATPKIVEEQSNRIRILSDSFNELLLISPPDEVLESSKQLLRFISSTPFEQYQDPKQHQPLSQEFSNKKTVVLESAKMYLEKHKYEFIEELKK